MNEHNTKEHTMQQFAVIGWPVTGCPFESQLERTIRHIKAGARKVIDFFTSPF